MRMTLGYGVFGYARKAGYIYDRGYAVNIGKKAEGNASRFINLRASVNIADAIAINAPPCRTLFTISYFAPGQTSSIRQVSGVYAGSERFLSISLSGMNS